MAWWKGRPGKHVTKATWIAFVSGLGTPLHGDRFCSHLVSQLGGSFRTKSPTCSMCYRLYVLDISVTRMASPRTVSLWNFCQALYWILVPLWSLQHLFLWAWSSHLTLTIWVSRQPLDSVLLCPFVPVTHSDLDLKSFPSGLGTCHRVPRIFGSLLGQFHWFWWRLLVSILFLTTQWRCQCCTTATGQPSSRWLISGCNVGWSKAVRQVAGQLPTLMWFLLRKWYITAPFNRD